MTDAKVYSAGIWILAGAMLLAAPTTHAQTMTCQANGAGSGTTAACTPPPTGSPLPPYLFNNRQGANIQALQNIAIWSGSVLSFGNARFVSGETPQNFIGGSVATRSWRDKGGLVVSGGLAGPGSDSRTTARSVALQDIYDAGSALGLEGDQSLYAGVFGTLSDSRTTYAADDRETNERDLSLSAAAAYRNGQSYLIGLVSAIGGRGSLGNNASGAFGRYDNTGVNAMVTAGRRFGLVDPAIRGFALDLDVSAHAAWFEGHSSGFADDRGTVYGKGRARSWVAGAQGSLQFTIPGEHWRWTPYLGMSADRYLSPRVSVDATSYHPRIDYVSKQTLSGVQTGFSMADAKGFTISVQAYSQGNTELSDTGVLLSLSKPLK